MLVKSIPWHDVLRPGSALDDNWILFVLDPVRRDRALLLESQEGQEGAGTSQRAPLMACATKT
jgi:hypothetical protein